LKGSASELDAAASAGRPPQVEESDAIPIASPPPVSGEIESGSERRAVPRAVEREAGHGVGMAATALSAGGQRKVMVIAVAAIVIVAVLLILLVS
ncbi:MAG: hypothetical protein AB7L28_26925, partial [Kofleriaceae bacterium]